MNTPPVAGPAPAVLVTGAGGFVGGRLAERLAAQRVPVRGLVRRPPQAAGCDARGAEPVVGDLTVPESLTAAVRGVTLVFHCAAWMGRPLTWEAAFAVNVVGTHHLLGACLAAGVRRFVHVSTISVYGPTDAEMIDEGTPLWLLGPYRGSKAAAEHEVRRAGHRGLETIIVRPGQVFGPGDRRLSGFTLRWLRRGVPLLVDGGGGACHPIYVDNLVDALLAAGSVPQAAGGVFNLADGDVPWREFLGWYARMVGGRLRSMPAWTAGPLARGTEALATLLRRPALMYRAELAYLVRHSRYSTDRARAVLGWSPRVPMDEAMAATEAWLQQAGLLR